MKIEKLLRYNAEFRTIAPLYRVVTKRNTGHWAYSRTMAVLWFVTTAAHNASTRRFNVRYLKAKCIADRRKLEIQWSLIICWAIWIAISALILWFVFNIN